MVAARCGPVDTLPDLIRVHREAADVGEVVDFRLLARAVASFQTKQMLALLRW
jgi:hypothetical protein